MRFVSCVNQSEITKNNFLFLKTRDDSRRLIHILKIFHDRLNTQFWIVYQRRILLHFFFLVCFLQKVTSYASEKVSLVIWEFDCYENSNGTRNFFFLAFRCCLSDAKSQLTLNYFYEILFGRLSLRNFPESTCWIGRLVQSIRICSTN